MASRTYQHDLTYEVKGSHLNNLEWDVQTLKAEHARVVKSLVSLLSRDFDDASKRVEQVFKDMHDSIMHTEA